MRPFVWRAGAWAPGTADIAALAERHGVYDTMQVTGGTVRRADLHLERFAAGCRLLGLPCGHGPWPPDGLEGTWTLRWLRWREPGGSATLGVLTPGSLLPPGDPLIAVGLVPAGEVALPPAPRVKTLALFARRSLLARLREERGWDDYLVADDEGVLEGSHWALLTRSGDGWVAPTVREGLLESTHVRRLMEVGSFEGLPLAFGAVSVSDVVGSRDLRGVSASGVRRLSLAPDADALLQG